jgi:hypothetical protein
MIEAVQHSNREPSSRAQPRIGTLLVTAMPEYGHGTLGQQQNPGNKLRVHGHGTTMQRMLQLVFVPL